MEDIKDNKLGLLKPSLIEMSVGRLPGDIISNYTRVTKEDLVKDEGVWDLDLSLVDPIDDLAVNHVRVLEEKKEVGYKGLYLKRDIPTTYYVGLENKDVKWYLEKCKRSMTIYNYLSAQPVNEEIIRIVTEELNVPESHINSFLKINPKSCRYSKDYLRKELGDYFYYEPWQLGEDSGGR